MFKQISKKDILQRVKKSLVKAKTEIVTTMFLKEELINPLSSSYFHLLKKKVEEGIVLKRLGFGSKEDYNIIKQRIKIQSKDYIFKYIADISNYQRLIIIDGKELFFGKDGIFFQSKYKPLLKIYMNYFDKFFRRGKL